MSGRKPTPAKRRSGGNKQPREAFHMAPELHDALVRCAESSDPPATKTAVIVAALKSYLAARGFLPPPDAR